MEKAADGEERLQVQPAQVFVSVLVCVHFPACACVPFCPCVPVSGVISMSKAMSMLILICMQVLERLLQLDVHVSDLLLSPVGKVTSIQTFDTGLQTDDDDT